MKKTSLKTKKGLIAFLALFILLYVIIYVVPKVSDIFTQTYIAQYGTLEVSRKEEAVVVRSEEVYKASAGGSLQRKAQGGQLLRAGNAAVTVAGSDQAVSGRGIVSYYYDGYESRITPDNMESLSESIISEFKEGEGVKDTASGTVEAGSVVFKLIDTSKWYLVFWSETDDAQVFSQGDSVLADMGDGERIQMTVKSITKSSEKKRIVLECDRYYDDFDKYRVRECSIIASSYSGIILNTDSIVEKDGVKGVYVMDKFNKTNFVPIMILSEQNGKTVVEKNYFYDREGQRIDTVKNYDEIVKSGNR